MLAYLDMYGKTLEHDIKGDTSGDTRKFFLALINSKRDQGNYQLVERDITELYNAGGVLGGRAAGGTCPAATCFPFIFSSSLAAAGDCIPGTQNGSKLCTVPLAHAGAARWGTDESTFINLITAHDNV